MDIYDKANKVNSQEDFVQFLKHLKKDLEVNIITWDNNTLESYISGLEGYCMDKKQQRLDWSILAEILLAAKVYE